jgi:AraC-like DNA-binding protein
MVRKIYLEIGIEHQAEGGGEIIQEFRSLLAQVVSKFASASCRITAYDNKAILCSEPELTDEIRQTDFEVGALKFNIKFSDRVNGDFIRKCVDVITSHLDVGSFTMQNLAESLHLSKPTFYRKIKTITGLSAKDFIRRIKMEIAYQLLVSRKYNVTEVAWKCGYSNARHFSKVFYAVFHQYPSRLQS